MGKRTVFLRIDFRRADGRLVAYGDHTKVLVVPRL
ncbi:hypothetical protein BVRB_028340 [Beta vulgaris subsp. vulgaris]|uniref:Uncharacterized protein n=1 Tax=Beta vulgaris subsp. vulgaris TaxID=3555 RepID=A0A0J8DSM5_BETVV|nr:hypothetical protein BVRB_028340 [Beta vulgaris subsp. vulgaris]